MIRTSLLAIGLFSGAIAGCSQDSTPKTGQAGRLNDAARESSSLDRAIASRPRSAVASLPDRGELLAYRGNDQAVKRGATTWHPVDLSEEHAFRAVATGELRLATPEGRPLQFKYQRHIEHKNGNWTWVGKMQGAASGREAVLTFGQNAVFGSIPYDDAEPLKLAMSGGATWLVQTDPLLAAAGMRTDTEEPDFVIPGTSRARGGAVMAAGAKRVAPPLAYSHTSSHATVDIALGYTAGLAASLGGDSQAVTRLTHLVDLANQAFSASDVDGELRLVSTVRVEYPDATNNRNALFDLTGVACTSGSSVTLPDGTVDCAPAERPATLAPLIEAREAFGADVVALVRRFETPENGSCGVGWLIGGGQQEITSADADYAMSVVSDTSPEGSCRDDTLAHEVGHNMGLQHDRETAQEDDDSNNDGNLLDPDEYGRFAYSFAHSTSSLYTIMAIRRPGQTGYLVYSNPALTTCGGEPCGVQDEADNALALNLTMPLVANFRATVLPPVAGIPSDFDGDERSDILMRYSQSAQGNLEVWRMSGATRVGRSRYTQGASWRVAAIADFNGDGRSDILWNSGLTRTLTMWLSAPGGFTGAVVGTYPEGWSVAGTGDVGGDGRADIVFRDNQSATGNLRFWMMNGAVVFSEQAYTQGSSWAVAAVADFNGDGKSDILWNSAATRQLTVWLSRSTGGYTGAVVGKPYKAGWSVAGVADANHDGLADIYLRYNQSVSGNLLIWVMNGGTVAREEHFTQGSSWKVASLGDFNGDGKADILWDSASTRTFTMWLSRPGGYNGALVSQYASGWSAVPTSGL